MIKSVTHIIFLSFVAFSCSIIEDQSSHQILDEYYELNYNSWKRIRNADYLMFSTYEKGDTITLNAGIRLIMAPHDTISEIPLTKDAFLNIDEPTRICLVEANEDRFYQHTFKFRTIDLDSTVIGYINSDNLTVNQEGAWKIINEKDRYMKMILEEKNFFDDRIEELAKKNNLSEDSLFKVLAKQYFEATGNPIMTH